jgi:hypothetical protein
MLKRRNANDIMRKTRRTKRKWSAEKWIKLIKILRDLSKRRMKTENRRFMNH